MKTSVLLLLAAGVVLAAATATAQPYYAPGSYQGWTLPQSAPELKDDGTGGDVTSGDGVYSATVNIATAGAYEWKAAIADWASSWPGSGNCWFITTANNLHGIPVPLQDRMEIIKLNGYTEEEKLRIAEGFLVPKQLEANGFKPGDILFTDKKDRCFLVIFRDVDIFVRTSLKHYLRDAITFRFEE